VISINGFSGHQSSLGTFKDFYFGVFQDFFTLLGVTPVLKTPLKHESLSKNLHMIVGEVLSSLFRK